MTSPPRVAGRRRVATRRRLFLAIALGIPALTGTATAHDFWIQPSRFWLAQNQPASLAILVGHGPARQRWVLRLNRVVALISIDPDGRRTDHGAALRQGTYAPDAQLAFGKTGVHVIAFENTPALNALPAARFNDYLAAEGIRPAIVERQRTGSTNQPGRESYSRRAKALVQVGAPSGPQPMVTRPIGLTLEIVPDIDPYSPRGAKALPVRVVYRGHVQTGAFVKLTNLNDDERPVETHITDAAGRATFRLPKTGEWQFNVVWTSPARGNPDADFDTIFSSLTFGFPKP